MKTITTIRNCPPVFRLICPLKWGELTVTDEPNVRHCGQCDRSVYFCDNDDDTIRHATAGHCIAREMPDDSEIRKVYVGQSVGLPPETPRQTEARRLKNHEDAVNDAIENAPHSSRSCPRCHYPARNWRKVCRVCRFEFGRVMD